MTTATPSSRSLLLISQVYVPDSPAVGQHLADVAEHFVRHGWLVDVLTSARGYDDPSVVFPSTEVVNGVRVRRLPFSSFGKKSIVIRLVAQSLFLAQALVRSLFRRRPSVVLVSTSPPMAGYVGSLIASIRSVPLVWWVMDLNPDQMIATGNISPTSLPARLFDWMNRRTLTNAKAVIVLDEFMRDRVLAKLSVPDKVHVCPPWAPPSVHRSDSSDAARFRSQHGLHDKFVVMYSGNHSIQHPLTTVLEASRRLVDDDRLRFVFVGGGSGKADVEALVRDGSRNIVSLPYQPLERVAETLAAADLHVVSVGDNSVGIVHPCKLYGIMAAAKPTLLVAPDCCYATSMFKSHSIGWAVRHGDIHATVAAIRMAASDPRLVSSMGTAARALMESEFASERLIGAVFETITEAAIQGCSRGAPPARTFV